MIRLVDSMVKKKIFMHDENYFIYAH